MWHNKLEEWNEQYRGNTNKYWNKVMDHWLSGEGSCDYPATWEGLYVVLNEVGLGQVARELKTAVVGQ